MQELVIDPKVQFTPFDSPPAFFSFCTKMNSDFNGGNAGKAPELNLHDAKVLSQAKTAILPDGGMQLPEIMSADISTAGGEEKKMKRVLANRRSARESYQRRKKMFSELETSVTELTKENQELVDENKKLRRQVLNLRQQLGLGALPTASVSNNNMMQQQQQGNSLAMQSLLSPGASALAAATQTRSQSQLQLSQQQGELDHLLELILRGRSAP